MNPKNEIMADLFKELLKELESSNDVESFKGLVDQVLVEVVMSFSYGDIRNSAKILKLSQKELTYKISKLFGASDVVNLYASSNKLRKGDGI